MRKKDPMRFVWMVSVKSSGVVDAMLVAGASVPALEMRMLILPTSAAYALIAVSSCERDVMEATYVCTWTEG